MAPYYQTEPKSVPGTEDTAVVGSHVHQELTAWGAIGHHTVVHVVTATAFLTMELLAVVLPGQWVTGAVVVGEAVRTLTVVGLQGEIVGAGAYDETVVGTEGEVDLALLGSGEGDVLRGSVVVAGGLQVAHSLRDTRLDLAEMATVAQYARQLTRQGVERRVENEVATVVAADGLVARTGRQTDKNERQIDE